MLEALVVCADLQGREVPPGLISDLVPGELDPLLESLGIRSRERVGAILAGDLCMYPDLHARGGTGDVTSGWRAFATPDRCLNLKTEPRF